MHELLEQLDVLEQTANLSQSINDVQSVIDLLTAARDKIAAGIFPYRPLHSSSLSHAV
jgi:hypothetical protein